jgi:DNA mismatch endonuclease (patch repair protein)
MAMSRSEQMRRIRGKNTKPELIVRRLIFSMGYRYRLHQKNMPGQPDIIFPSRKAVIFVHGCFWHQHPDSDCKISHLPKSNAEYWQQKLARNQARDAEHESALLALGWHVLVIWECQLKDSEALKHKIVAFLDSVEENLNKGRYF